MSRLGSSAVPTRLRQLCPQGEPGSLARGGQPGASRMWTRHRQAWGRGAPEGSSGRGLCRGAGKAKPTARPPSTLRPTGGCIEHAHPVQPAALCCPPVAATQGPTPPPTRPQLRAAGWARGQPAGPGAGGQLGRRLGRGCLGGGHRDLGTHTAGCVTPCPSLGAPGQPHTRASPALRHGPRPTLITFMPSRGGPAGPAEQQGAGAREGPCHGRRPCPPHSDPGPPGLPPSATQGAARSHADGISGGWGCGQPVLPSPGDQESLHGSGAHSPRTCRCEWAAVSSVKEPRAPGPWGQNPCLQDPARPGLGLRAGASPHTPHRFP